MRDGGYTSQGGWCWVGDRFGRKEFEGDYAFTLPLSESFPFIVVREIQEEADIRNRDMVPTQQEKEGNMRLLHCQRLCSQRD